MTYERPYIVKIGTFQEDTTDNRPWLGWDFHVSARA